MIKTKSRRKRSREQEGEGWEEEEEASHKEASLRPTPVVELVENSEDDGRR